MASTTTRCATRAKNRRRTRQAPEQHLLHGIEQRVAPFKRGAQCLLRAGASRAPELSTRNRSSKRSRRPVRPSSGRARRPTRSRAHAVEPRQISTAARVSGFSAKPRCAARPARRTARARRSAGHHPRRRLLPPRHSQRSQPHHLFTGHAQRRLRRGQHVHAGRATQDDLDQRRDFVQHVFAVVEEEKAACSRNAPRSSRPVTAGRYVNAERRRNRWLAHAPDR